MFAGTNGVTMFYSNDAGRTFQSYDNGTPFVRMPGASRDAKVFRDAARDRWAMVVWSDEGGNGVNIYSSPNLRDWTFRSRFAAGWLFECPDFVALPVDGDASRTQWVLSDAGSEYVVGDFDGSVFRTDWPGPQRMDHGRNDPGGSFYAAQVFTNAPQGVVQMAWMPSNRGATWTGNATFPVTLGLRGTPAGPRVTRTPVPAVSSLRHRTHSFRDRSLTPASAAQLLRDQSVETYEVQAEFELAPSTTRFGFRLDNRPDGTSGAEVVYDVRAGSLMGTPLPPVGNRVKVRMLVDRGQLEVFGDDGLFSRSDNVAFDQRSDSRGVSLFSEGDVRLESGTAAGLTFRADARGAGYTANVDAAAGVVKLWRPGRDIASYPVPVGRGATYHLKVVVEGTNIKVYLDGGVVIDAHDEVYASGRFGLNVYASTARFQDVRVG